MTKISRARTLTMSVLFLLVASLLTGCGQTGNGDLYQLTGSDSEVNVVQSLVEGFSDVNGEVEFAVTGGGSGVGIAAIIDGTADVANSSRPMSEEEINQAKDNQVDPVPIVFAFDGVAVVINEENPVEELTLEELGKIYSGEVSNWSEVGGADMDITLFGRQPTSGTFVFFRELVVKGDYSDLMNQMPGTSAIIEGVLQDRGGVGYAAIGYVKGAAGIKALSIAADDGAEYISPLDDEKVFSGEYVMTRPLYHYVNGRPEGALREFFEFELSDVGQEIVIAEGFLPVTPEFMEQNKEYLGQ